MMSHKVSPTKVSQTAHSARRTDTALKRGKDGWMVFVQTLLWCHSGKVRKGEENHLRSNHP